jgi:hypothetical protein
MHTANRQWFGKLVLKGIAQSYWTKQHVTIKIVNIVTKFLGRWGRGTGSWYMVRYLRETFTLRVENEPVNPGRGRRTWVEGRRW